MFSEEDSNQKTIPVSDLTNTIITKIMKEKAEMQNGRWAMVGIVAAIGAYAFSGQIIPGIF